MSTSKVSLCRYHYSALDVLTEIEPAGQQPLQRFYCHEHLATELHGPASQSVFQHGTQLLALHSRNGDDLDSQLLITDQQRSVLQVTDSDGAVQRAYSPYGHRRVDGGDPGSVLEFNGEAVDGITGHYPLGNGHRSFNPVLMRFNSSDRLSPFARGGLNSYAYCPDPVNYSDPTGRFAEIGRLITSILGLSNTGLGMTRAIPSFNLARDALAKGALKELPARQGFAAASTVVASGAILTTGVVGVASAVVAIVEDPEAAKILGYVALGLTTLAIASRVGTYWAARKPGTEAALVSFVKNKGQVSTATPPRSPRPSLSFEPSAPPLTPGISTSQPLVIGEKRTYDTMLGSETGFDRVILNAKRLKSSDAVKKIRRNSI